MNTGHLLVHAAPEELLKSVDGKVWEVVVASADLTDLRRSFVVGATTRTGEGVRTRVVGDTPPTGAARTVQPTLEDAYLRLLARDQDRTAHE